MERLLENNNTLTAEIITKISDLNAVVRTQNQQIEGLETQLQQSRCNNMIIHASPQAADKSSRVLQLENATKSPRPQQSAKVNSMPQKEQHQRSPARDFVLGVICSVMPNRPSSVNSILQRQHAVVDREISSSNTNNDSSPYISKNIFELVKSGQLAGRNT